MSSSKRTRTATHNESSQSTPLKHRRVGKKEEVDMKEEEEEEELRRLALLRDTEDLLNQTNRAIANFNTQLSAGNLSRKWHAVITKNIAHAEKERTRFETQIAQLKQTLPASSSSAGAGAGAASLGTKKRRVQEQLPNHADEGWLSFFARKAKEYFYGVLPDATAVLRALQDKIASVYASRQEELKTLVRLNPYDAQKLRGLLKGYFKSGALAVEGLDGADPSSQRLDMVNAKLYDKLPATQDIIDALDAKCTSVIVLAPSGWGKSTSIAATAREKFTVAMECTCLGSDRTSSDTNFMTLMEDVMELIKVHKDANLQEHVGRRLLQECVGRLWFLKLLLDLQPELTPEAFWFAQWHETGTCIISDLIAAAKRITTTAGDWHVVLSRLKSSIQLNTTLVWSLDEAGAGFIKEELGYPNFSMPGSNSKTGIAGPLVGKLVAASIPVVMAGTERTMYSRARVVSNMGNETTNRLVTSYQLVSSPVKLTREYVTVGEEEEKELVQLFGENGAARGRVFGNALRDLPLHIKRQHRTPLVEAFRQSYSLMRESVKKEITNVLSTRSRKDPTRSGWTESLLKVFLAAKLFGGEVYADDMMHSTLYEMGIFDCRIISTEEEKIFGFFKIREPLVVEAIEEVLAQEKHDKEISAALEGIKQCVDLMKRNYNSVTGKGTKASGKGDDAETVEGFLFYFLSEEAKDKEATDPQGSPKKNTRKQATAGTLLCTSLGQYILAKVPRTTKTQLLGSFLNKTPWKVSKLSRFQGTNERKYMGSEESTGHYWQPSKQHRADGLLRMSKDCIVAVGSKLYSTPIATEMTRSQERSTNISLSYSRADRDDFTTAMKPYSAEWKQQVVDHTKGVLRVHFLFPRAAQPKPKLCEVTKTKARTEITVNIDMDVFEDVFVKHQDQEARKVFSKLGEMLAVLSGTKKLASSDTFATSAGGVPAAKKAKKKKSATGSTTGKRKRAAGADSDEDSDDASEAVDDDASDYDAFDDGDSNSPQDAGVQKRKSAPFVLKKRRGSELR